MQRNFESFQHKEALLRICCCEISAVKQEIVRQRRLLEAYILRQPAFQRVTAPIVMLDDAPPIAVKMMRAAVASGVGPMAAVAGAMAEAAADAGLAAGADEAVVDNGGDLYLSVTAPAMVSIEPGTSSLSGRLAFRVLPEDSPIAICSSSGRMGHSMSMGDCDLATVVARDAALADAVATATANRVRSEGDVDVALQWAVKVAGVSGVLVVKGQRVGMAGELPELVRVG